MAEPRNQQSVTNPLSVFAFEQLPVPAGIIELDGTIAAINDAAAALLGRSATDAIGKKAWDVASGGEHAWGEVLRDVRENGEARGDITIATPRGPCAIRYLAALRSHEGRSLVLGFGVERDPGTEVARTQDAHAKQRLEALGLVAGGIAHDFNNQLTSVLAEATAARDSGNLNPQALESLRRVEASANRMARLVRQLLAYAGRGRFVTELLDPDALVRDAGEPLMRLVRPDVELSIAANARGIVIEADRGLLLQVVGNLVTNASEARSSDGSIEISTSVQGSSDGTGWWQLVIRDDGAGMEPETISRIWDPFFTMKAGHHGLGLSAVVGIVRRLNGEIHVESRPGVGSTFTVRLPIVAGAQPRRARTTSMAGHAVSLEGLRALIVDDEPSVRTTIRRLLERRKAVVVTAADGTEAEARLREGQYNFMVLDVMMPGLTGYQLLPIARATNPDARIMLMSGYSDVAHAADDAEPDVFLEKPFTAKTFDEAIDRLLG